MTIFESKEIDIRIADIESLRELISFGFYNPDNEQWDIFKITKTENQLVEFVNYYTKLERCVWYNGLDFDCQVIEYILRNYQNWLDYDNVKLINTIKDYANSVIQNKKFSSFAQYRESEFTIPCFDVFTILGLNNQARLSSLKKCEFQLDYPSLEEMPIHHEQTGLTLEDEELVLSYMKNDILATFEVFKICLGTTEHVIYKGNNQIELRYNIVEEFKLDCLNYSDIKIGEELMIQSYLEETGLDRKELPKSGTFRKEIKLKDCIPEYIEFLTPTLQNILKSVKKRVIKQDESISYEFDFYGTHYELKNGGLHSKNEGEMYDSNANYIIYTSDVGSFYPASKIQRKIYPKHLGVKFLNTYEKRYNKRIELKPASKIDKKIKGICDAIKLQLNIIFGKLGSKESLFFDMKALLSVTIGNEFTLLKLIEDCELNGFHVFSANTDGIEVMVKRNEEHKYLEICENWCKLTGYILEHDQYEWIKYSTVNDYIAKTTSGKYKQKGDLLSDFELYKNKSYRVVALAVQEYFKNGTSPVDFIKNHKNIYDFCIMARATGQLYLEFQNSAGETKKMKKLIRYYLCKDSDWELYKRGIGTTGKPANISSHAPNELGEIKIRYFNQYVEMDDYQIDYNQYIYKSLKILSKIEKSDKLKQFINSVASKQISMFD